jgi:phage recombination protein Bet
VTDLEVVPGEIVDRYPKPPPLTVAKLDAVRDHLAPGLSDAELSLFVDIVNHSGLDPFYRQIWAYKRGEKLVIQAAIDGLRLIALRTGLYGGQLAAKWCGLDRVWTDVWLDKTPPAAAMKAVIRKDYPTPTTAVAIYDSYVAKDKNGKPVGVWASGPEIMLAKCAEALALRQAFPAETAGLYIEGEIPTDNPVPVVTQPAPGDLPVTTDDRLHLRASIEALSDQAQKWLFGKANAESIPHFDLVAFKRHHRDEMAWYILVAQRIKPAADPETGETP